MLLPVFARTNKQSSAFFTAFPPTKRDEHPHVSIFTGGQWVTSRVI